MEHIFYFDGTPKKITWSILTGDSVVEQSRDHAEMYMDKISNIQSKCIALHVGLFWGVGTFVIKNEDTVIVKTDEKSIHDNLKLNKKDEDEFVEKRIEFIKQLIVQRKLKVKYDLISGDENSSKKIFCKGA